MKNKVEKIFKNILLFLIKKIFNYIKYDLKTISVFHTKDWISWGWIKYYCIWEDLTAIIDCENISKNNWIWFICWLFNKWIISKDEYIKIHKYLTDNK